MSAVKLSVDWVDKGEAEQFFPPLEPTQPLQAANPRPAIARQIAPAASALRCPHCTSIIYSRRNKLCGVCGEELPKEFLFTSTEARKVERTLRSEQMRHRL
ncbi:MAG: hypothetical protein FJ403_21240 [Verrucomicrobia bacterium]|nr:hypothetical protein [Verrucomicrobiota bacterium]